MGTTWGPQGCGDHVGTTCRQHGDNMETTCGDNMVTTGMWRPHGDNIETTWRQCGDHIGTTWGP